MADYNFIRLKIGNFDTKDYNLYVVSNGGLYTNALTPKFENRTTSVPGRPGFIYWGTDVTNQEFTVSLATDGITGKQLNELKKALKLDEVLYITFEEYPYKYYAVLIMEQPIFSFVPFLTVGEQKENLFKGEFELKFMTLSPYAGSTMAFGPTSYEEHFWWKESGLPTSDDVPNDNNYYYLSMGMIARNGVVGVEASMTPLNVIYQYNAGNAPAPIKMSFSKTFTLGEPTGSVGPKINWIDFEINDCELFKPRFFIDIEFALQKIYEASDEWASKKEATLNILREELDGPAKESILYLTNAFPTTYSTFSALLAKFREVFFTNRTYTFVLNGITNQSVLSVEGIKISPTLAETNTIYREDNSGATNGKYIVLAPSGILPLDDGAEEIVSTTALSDIEIIFEYAYI